DRDGAGVAVDCGSASERRGSGGHIYAVRGNRFVQRWVEDLTATATWGSSNTSVTITATSGTVSGSMGLTVEAATLTSIVISGEPTVTIADGTSYQFKALGFYNDGSKHYITTQVTWASSNPSAATIGVSTGRAQSVAGGGGMQTTITATLGSVVGTVTLDVTSATIQSIAVGPSSTKIAPLTTETFTAIGTFSDGSTQNITQDV